MLTHLLKALEALCESGVAHHGLNFGARGGLRRGRAPLLVAGRFEEGQSPSSPI